VIADTDIFAGVSTTRDTTGSLEIQRICQLPVVAAPTPEEVDAFSHQVVDARYYEQGFRLFDTQVWAVLQYVIYGGVFGPIGVGWGKTLITLMIADWAKRLYGIDRTALFVPPQTYSQLTRTDIPWARKRVGLTVPFIYMGGRTLAERKSITASGKRGCYILPYSYLSTRDAEDMLNRICPELMILDEAHNVKNQRAARTSRLLRFLAQYRPQLVALSGTITSKSLKDYWHLISHALGNNSPLPLSAAMIEQWSLLLDASADPDGAQTGDMNPLLMWAGHRFPEVELPEGRAGYRKAFNLRLSSAPGVVATGDAEIGVSLTISNNPVKSYKEHPDWERNARLIRDVIELWRAPNGDEIEYGFHQWRHLYELTSGFYYDLRWPSVEQVCKRQGITPAEAEVAIAMAKEHHEALQEYHRKLRRFLQYGSRPKLDTPLLVANDMARNGSDNVWPELYEAWKFAKGLEFPGMPQRYSVPVEVCDYKARHLVEWAKNHKQGGLIWYHHDHFGRWVNRLLQEDGAEPVWCPAEGVRAGSNDRIREPSNGERIVVGSMGGHGTGKNLQHFQSTVFGEFPRPAPLAEQVIGRNHRNGQEADELTADTINTIPFDDHNMAACLNDALYHHQTLGARQRLIIASYDPIPRVFPPDFLRERSFVDLQRLDADALLLMEEKFGNFEGL